MSSFPSLHDALSSLLPGARGGPEWLLRPGMPGFGDGVDNDDRRGDPARGNGVPDLDVDSVHRSPHAAETGGGAFRHAHSEAGIPPQARQAMSDALRVPTSQPLAPPQAQWDPSTQALARELQQLPPSVLRQLSDALSSNPAALRALPAQPEALAAVLARATSEAAPTMHAAAAEARRQPHGAEGAHPARSGSEVDPGRELRLAASQGVESRAGGDTRVMAGALESRAALAGGEARLGQPADARPAWAADPTAPGTARAHAGSPEAPLHPAPPRAEPQAPAHPSGAPAGAAGTTHAATPTQQEGGLVPGARAEAAGTSAERGAQGPGLGGLGGVAAGVTLAGVATPAGTTHAHAPESAVRARGAEHARDRRRKRDDADADGGAPDRRARGQHQKHSAEAAGRHGGAAAPAATAALVSLGAAGTSATGAATTARTGKPGSADAAIQVAHPHSQPVIDTLGHAIGHTGAAQRQQATPDALAAPDQDEAPGALHSRRRQWLYWSLIAVTYACLGLALATVAPRFSGLSIAQESLDLWRNGLTGVGLLTGLWAWLLARRMP